MFGQINVIEVLDLSTGHPDVLSDVSGVTGQAIIKAILSGERDPHKLAALRDWRVKANQGQLRVNGGKAPAQICGSGTLQDLLRGH